MEQFHRQLRSSFEVHQKRTSIYLGLKNPRVASMTDWMLVSWQVAERYQGWRGRGWSESIYGPVLRSTVSQVPQPANPASPKTTVGLHKKCYR